MNSIPLLSLTSLGTTHATFIHPLLPSGNADVGSSIYTLQTPWVSSDCKTTPPRGPGTSLSSGRFDAESRTPALAPLLRRGDTVDPEVPSTVVWRHPHSRPSGESTSSEHRVLPQGVDPGAHRRVCSEITSRWVPSPLCSDSKQEALGTHTGTLLHP